jgi:hypothetical protein
MQSKRRLRRGQRARAARRERGQTGVDEVSSRAIMEKHELRAATSLAAVFSVRMLGLFMVYPVFAAFARHLAGGAP